MLFLLFTWSVLSIVSIGIGVALFPKIGSSVPSTSNNECDLLLFWSWIGIGCLSLLNFAVALIVPLQMAFLPILLLAISTAIWGWFRLSFKNKSFDSLSILFSFLVIALLLAERSIAVGNLEDAGGYHWGLIKWYGESGIPFGLGLFQWKLATHSSWLALTAWLNQGALTSRVSNVANGMILVWTLTHLLHVLTRWFKGNADKADIFVAIAYLTLITSMLPWEMRRSPSPDIPVLLLCVVVPWAWLRFYDKRLPKDVGTALLFLSAFAVTVKLNGIPLLCAVTLLLLWEWRKDWKAWWRITLIPMMTVAPLITASFISTGCVLFPASFLCLNVQWGIGAETAKFYSTIINATAPHDIAKLLWICLICGVLVIAKLRCTVFITGWHIVAIAVIGIAFVMQLAPTSRFGMGYLALLPALAAALYFSTFSWRWPDWFRRISKTLILVLIGISLILPLYKEFIYRGERQRTFDSVAARKQGDVLINAFNPHWYLWPNKIDYQSTFKMETAYDFSYAVTTIPPCEYDKSCSTDPKLSQCWDHALPCASNPTRSHIPVIRLRDSAKGIAGGFVRR